MNPKIYGWLLLILLVALTVRLYLLDSVPYGFHVDEVKAGWNAYSILTTGRDDKGNFLPVYYDSFGDFRPAGLIYLIIPSIMMFGKTVFAVRFPFALFGALSIIPMYFLVYGISNRKNIRLALIASILLALNPWHIIASRATSESIIAIYFCLWGLYFFINIYRTKIFRYAILSYLTFGLSFFFYHSIRILAPLFLIYIIIFYKIFFYKNTPIVKQVIVLAILMATTIFIFLSPAARGRMTQVSLKSDFQVLYEITKMPNEEGPGHVLEARIFHNKIASYTRRLAEEYKEYFGTSFLTGNIAKPVRYTVPYIGLITYFEYIFFVIGLFWVSKKNEMLMILGLLILAPLPAAVTIEDNPNLQRAIFMIPFWLIIAGYGFNAIFSVLKRHKIITYLFVSGYILNFIYFAHMYFVHQKMSIAIYYRDGGNVELINKLSRLYDEYNKIILTNSPDDLYPWVAFERYEDANKFNYKNNLKNKGIRQVDKFIFSKDKCPIQKLMEKKEVPVDNGLYVDAEGCIYNDMLEYPGYIINEIDVIRRPDGSPPYYLRTVEYKKL